MFNAGFATVKKGRKENNNARKNFLAYIVFSLVVIVLIPFENAVSDL